MKTLVLIASLFTAAVATAQTAKMAGVINYRVVRSTFSTSHVFNPGKGTLTMDYSKSTVTLNVEETNQCPKGMMCALVMRPNLNVKLPIVSIKTDSCGIRHILAKIDQRPVDGALTQLTVVDPAQMTCKTFVAVETEATYTTQYVNRMNGNDEITESKMILARMMQPLNDNSEVLETSLAPAILIKMVQNAGFSPNPGSRTLYVDVTGRIINVNHTFRDNKTTTTNLGQMSAAALKNLSDKVAAIHAHATLVDEKAGEPMCTDAPSSDVVVTVNNQDVSIHRHAGCHEFSLENNEDYALTALMEGLQTLAR